jgi:transcriptional regulator with XRE-family HTH domain
MARWPQVLRSARGSASQDELARRSGTSRTALSAYEHGRKAPTADTLERIIEAAGARLAVERRVGWIQVELGGPRTCWVPDALWRLPAEEAFGDVVLPVEVNWSSPGRVYRCTDRRQRARLYEVLLREGQPEDLERHVDGALLVDAWSGLTLPTGVRAAWASLIDPLSERSGKSAPADSTGTAG